jgi:hypothetical protein
MRFEHGSHLSSDIQKNFAIGQSLTLHILQLYISPKKGIKQIQE